MDYTDHALLDEGEGLGKGELQPASSACTVGQFFRTYIEAKCMSARPAGSKPTSGEETDTKAPSAFTTPPLVVLAQAPCLPTQSSTATISSHFCSV